MGLHRLHRRQGLALPLEEAWRFLSDPRNLASITPPEMGFGVHGDPGEVTYAGQIIEYTVRPLFGFPVHWVTEITHVQPPHFFVDEQRFGPYAFWHHQHRLREVAGGVEMEDLIHYKLPLGPVGRLVEAAVVRHQLSAIFAYRRRVLADRYGELEPGPAPAEAAVVGVVDGTGFA